MSKKILKVLVCQIFRHSNILEGCFGYMYCGRCGELLGDTIGGVYANKKAVIIGHNCKACKVNYKNLTWKDKFLCPNPFKGEE